MKNFYFSIILFIVILIGSIASNIYVKEQMNMYNSYFKSILSEAPIDTETHTNIIKQKFYKQKNMLQMFINKEHIQELEISILLIENAIDSGTVSQNNETLIETICLVSHIMEYTTAIN